MNPRVIVLVFLALVALVFAPSAFAEPDLVDQAHALMDKQQYKQALDLLGEAVTDERMAEPRFMLAIADAARLYAPQIPLLNGGDRSRVNYFKDAGGVYLQVIASEKSDKSQKLLAKGKLGELKQAMLKEADEARKDKKSEQIARVGQAMAELWRDDATGGLLIYEAGNVMNNQDVQLVGVRIAVMAGSDDADLYTLAARMEMSGTDEAGGKEAALGHLDAGLNVLPDDLELLNQKTRLLADMERKDEAMKTLVLFEKNSAKLEDEDERAKALGVAGMLYGTLGDQDTSIARYEAALKQLPDHFVFRYLAGSIYMRRASTQFIAMHDAAQDSPERAEHKQAYEAALQRSREHLEHAHQLEGPPDLGVMSALMQVYKQQGDDAAYLKMRNDIKKVENGEAIR